MIVPDVGEKILMLLECPNCGTKFKVPAQALGEVGRTVRCSQCSFEWFAEPRDLIDNVPPQAAHAADLPDEAEEFAPETLDEDIISALESLDSSADEALARRAERRKSSPESTSAPRPLLPAMLALAASLLLLIFAAVLYFQDTLEEVGLKGLYQSFGMRSLEGVKFAEIKAGKLMAKRTAYVLQGSVINTHKQDQPIPVLRVRVVDAQGSTLREWEFAKEGTIKAGEVMPFDTGKLDVAFMNDTHAIILDIGNGYDLMLRD